MTDAEERKSIGVLQSKVREVLAEKIADGLKELLLENLIEQAYYTAKVEMARDAMVSHFKRTPTP